MTDDNSNLVDMDNLDNFSNTFFGSETPPKDEAVATETEENEEVSENEDDALATEENEDTGEDENSEENPDGDETEEEEKPKPKGKKSFQERINEVIAEARNAERERDALRLEVEKLRHSRQPEASAETEAPKPQEAKADNVPDPLAVDENGERIYPLGELDLNYIRDYTRFTIAEETRLAKEEAQKADHQKMVEAAQEELKSSWLHKVEETEKELPDLREKLGEMTQAFNGIDPNYGEFLAATIMSCDYGPQIMYYLSQNIGEAQKIVASGPAAATLAIGRLDARFTKAPSGEKRNTKVSNAPNPPESRNRGSGTKTNVRGDTNDLGAFEKEFFNQK